MANITFTIPNDQVQGYQDAFASAYHYQETINGAPNPETKAQFAKRMVKQYMLEVYRAHKINAAVEEARAANQSATIDIS